MNYFSICCIIKDEDPFLDEWLTWHSLIGAEHFYIYDNDSATPARTHPAVKKYLDAGRATVLEISGKEMQLKVYNHCLQEFGKDNFWIAFIDLDEFICLRTPGREIMDVRPLLAEFEDQAGLGLNWQPFTSNGLLGSPDDLVISSYTRIPVKRNRDNCHIKSIMRPPHAVSAKNAHTFLTSPGYQMVNEEHRPIPQGWPFSQPSYGRIWLNHYHYKSQQDYEFKIARGRADVVKDDNADLKYRAFYAHLNDTSKKTLEIAKHAPYVRDWVECDEVPPQLPVPGNDSGQNGLGNYLELCQEFLSGKRTLATMPDGANGTGGADTASTSRERSLNLAQAVLCKAVCFFEGEQQLWVVRATLYRLQGNFEIAWRFINKAIGMGEHPFVYDELFHLTLVSKGKEKAAEVLEYMKDLPRYRPDDPAYVQKLELYEKLVRGN
ncbi:glycosyltransferase family 2 protein [Desulfovibrio sp. OttesenSCG-928-C06]|nr:glycosyltransferase family 2 protein [Desulfovibrio sp. OttesenSCG-928-C06]